MRWALGGIALVVVANAIALVPARRERAEPAAFSTIALCPGQLVGGAGSDLAPAIRLVLAPDSGPPAPGLDAEGLRALGFTERVIAVIGQERPTGFHWPSPRPAWVRLRQAPEDSLRQFVAAEVRPRRELLVADSGSIVIRALVGLRQRMAAPAAPPTEGHDHGGAARPPVPALMSASVLGIAAQPAAPRLGAGHRAPRPARRQHRLWRRAPGAHRERRGGWDLGGGGGHGVRSGGSAVRRFPLRQSRISPTSRFPLPSSRVSYSTTRRNGLATMIPVARRMAAT
ncbi:MAG: hypothetical protein IPJ95_17885 [Gemmatimonadetes bacterium]|nr:hypothetical protein [Gemmatimonadota bacterium]